MAVGIHVKCCHVLIGIFMWCILLYECKKLEGYKFSVYSTEQCPRNETEWNKKSSALNCTKERGYTCLPNENFTELLEFCYTEPRILIEAGTCLYLVKRVSKVNGYSCRRFQYGCHNTSFLSNEIFQYPTCISLGNGCFIAEPECKRKTNISRTTTEQIPADDDSHIISRTATEQIPSDDDSHNISRTTTEQIPADDDSHNISRTTTKQIPDNFHMFYLFFLLLLIGLPPLFSLLIRKYRGSKTERHNEENFVCLLEQKEQKQKAKNKESPVETPVDRAMFAQWERDNDLFIFTKACEEVEKITKSKNFVIVTGHSGSGKSAIIKHIALKYRNQGWIIKLVNKVTDIINIMNEILLNEVFKNKTLFVVEDPIGVEAFDKLAFDSWRNYEEQLRVCLNTAKLLMSCRTYVMKDGRLKGFFITNPTIIDINNQKWKLTEHEKRKILNIHTSTMNLSEEDVTKIVNTDMYFPLLCKLYSSNIRTENDGLNFFKEPVAVLEKEIKYFRQSCKEKYCALILLVLFNNDLCVNVLKEDEISQNKFERALELCGMDRNTSPFTFSDTLNNLEGFLVKKIGDTYKFYHDFVMDITILLFGKDYPVDTIQYADIGFLRRKIKLEDSIRQIDQFTICLSNRHIDQLGRRLFTELFGERLLDVILNPCLRNNEVIKVLEKQIKHHPEKLQILLRKIRLKIQNQEPCQTSTNLLLSKLSFLQLMNEVSPLFTLIVYCHDDLSKFCLQKFKTCNEKKQTFFLFPAVCCSGSIEIFQQFFKDNAKECLSEKWGVLFPVHILSLFHNFEILSELIDIGVDVNLKTDDEDKWTPLTLASGNDIEENDNYNQRVSCETRRDKTVQLLLNYGANVNLCMDNGTSPLYMACQNGYESTVQLLLNNEANINLCEEEGASPLYIACENGMSRTACLLLLKSADVNLCKKNGAGPLYIACQNGHENTVKLLLNKSADVNLSKANGATPLYIACQNRHESIARLLLERGANVNLRTKNGATALYIACENGINETVQRLLHYDADVNICTNDGISPYIKAKQNGHDITVELLEEWHKTCSQNELGYDIVKLEDYNDFFFKCGNSPNPFRLLPTKGE